MIKVKKSMVCLMAATIMFSSCIGSFGLFNKVLDWNQGATSSKFVNEIIFLVLSIIPVYEICAIADVLVLNTIEFWTGDNPVASNVGKTHNVMGSDGKMYAVTNLKDGYEIKNEAGDIVNFTFDKKEKVDLENAVKIVAITSSTYYKLPYNNGKQRYTYVVTALDRMGNESAGSKKKVKL